jgi:citrate synthase
LTPLKPLRYTLANTPIRTYSTLFATARMRLPAGLGHAAKDEHEMSIQTTPIAKGLEGIVIAQTEISDVNGGEGTLEYRGYPIKDLALNTLFEEVIFLLWYGNLPTQKDLTAFNKELIAKRAIPRGVMDVMRGFPKAATPIAVLRTAVSAMGLFDPEADDNSPEANARKAFRLTASMSTLVAAWDRIRNGQEPVQPRNDLPIAANFLYMLTGQEPDQNKVAAVNSYLVMLADHGMNASTFAARVTTSTLSDIYSAITTALGTLKGAAHGGANEKAMRQFIEIGNPAGVDAWFEQAMSSSMRVMGIGHRVYKTGDPRMFILKQQAADLAQSTGETKWYDIAIRLEDKAMAHPYFVERKLIPNVDYYSAITLYQSGIPIDLFTPLFAVSRVAGWCAHITEQWQDNRLIRPDVIYTGKHDQTWVPIEQRK